MGFLIVCAVVVFAAASLMAVLIFTTEVIEWLQESYDEICEDEMELEWFCSVLHDLSFIGASIVTLLGVQAESLSSYVCAVIWFFGLSYWEKRLVRLRITLAQASSQEEWARLRRTVGGIARSAMRDELAKHASMETTPIRNQHQKPPSGWRAG